MKNTSQTFLRKCPTANKDARFGVNMADPEEGKVSDDPKKNTTRCCQMCGISEGIARAKQGTYQCLVMAQCIWELAKYHGGLIKSRK